MLERALTPILRASLARFPVVALIGSRQTGKTTLAKALAAGLPGPPVYLDLERPADLAKLADPELYLEGHRERLVILDEIQRRPGLFPVLRALVDADRRRGRFLILGSASPALVKGSSESLAGRIVYHELGPLLASEVGPGPRRVERLWVRGGYPGSFLARSGAESLAWREAFIRTYLERDLPQLGLRVPAPHLHRFWQMLAHWHGQLWNASRLAASLGVSAPTVERYLQVLEETFLVRRLLPYHANLKKRLVKSPKVYFRDSGLLHALLRLPDKEGLLGHPVVGASWEGWVIEQVLADLPAGWDYSFYRTSRGAEVDLLLSPPKGAPIPVEIKRTLAPTVSRGFHETFADLGCKKGCVVYAGQETYPLTPRVAAVPVSELSRFLFQTRGPRS